ncbi:hypothetical protein ACSVH5_00995 [Flavobacterium sp. RSSA_27]|uniref:hypothetical protein n=1 Tax=Flavobacterium sp. RSSA_27 TaxID=3447667 RepID=UPI003F2BF0B6
MTNKLQEQLSREPKYVPHRWRLIPNIVINSIAIALAGLVVFFILYYLCRFVVQLFYHLN